MRFRGLSVALAIVLVMALASLVSAQAAPTIQTKDNPTLGTYLTDSRGMTLYIYTRDTAGVSNCTGNCLANWPALTVAAGTTPTAASGIGGTLGTITRTDNNATQVTLNGMPLYFYVKDQAAGDVTGQNVGTVWFVLDKSGNVVKTALPAAQATTAPAAAATAAPAMAAATATAAAPGTLPTTGAGSPDLAVLLVAAGALALLGGLTLRTARRTR
jgi:predicted lipoprotein with Yx(FWY)xxD motif